MILEYEEKYAEEVKDLLVELQEYIVSIDKDGYNIITEDYREEYFKKTIEEVSEFLNEAKSKLVKTLIYKIDNKNVGLF